MINWLASFPKSGSTWIRMLLHAYLFGDDDCILSTTGDLDHVYYQNVSAKPINELNLSEIHALRPAALSQIMNTWIVRPILVKTHHANLFMDEIPFIPFSLTKSAIYVVRDPRDIVLSYAHYFGVTLGEAIRSLGDEKRTVKEKDTQFHQCISSWSVHTASWINCDKYPVHVVKYEDLHQKTGEILKKVLEFLEITPDDKKIEQAIGLTQFDRLQANEKENGFIEANERPFFRSGKIGQWKTELSSLQVSKVMSDHAEMMDKLGYD